MNDGSTVIGGQVEILADDLAVDLARRRDVDDDVAAAPSPRSPADGPATSGRLPR